MSIWRKITDRSDLIIFPPTPPATNNPPQWDSQPSLIFVFGTASSYDMDDISSDPDLDSITHSKNATALPTGVTWTAATGVLSYDGVGASTTSSGHIFTLDDGLDTTDSDSVSITIADAQFVSLRNSWGMTHTSSVSRLHDPTHAAYLFPRTCHYSLFQPQNAWVPSERSTWVTNWNQINSINPLMLAILHQAPLMNVPGFQTKDREKFGPITQWAQSLSNEDRKDVLLTLDGTDNDLVQANSLASTTNLSKQAGWTIRITNTATKQFMADVATDVITGSDRSGYGMSTGIGDADMSNFMINDHDGSMVVMPKSGSKILRLHTTGGSGTIDSILSNNSEQPIEVRISADPALPTTGSLGSGSSYGGADATIYGATDNVDVIWFFTGDKGFIGFHVIGYKTASGGKADLFLKELSSIANSSQITPTSGWKYNLCNENSGSTNVDWDGDGTQDNDQSEASFDFMTLGFTPYWDLINTQQLAETGRITMRSWNTVSGSHLVKRASGLIDPHAQEDTCDLPNNENAEGDSNFKPIGTTHTYDCSNTKMERAMRGMYFGEGIVRTNPGGWAQDKPHGVIPFFNMAIDDGWSGVNDVDASYARFLWALTRLVQKTNSGFRGDNTRTPVAIEEQFIDLDTGWSAPTAIGTYDPAGGSLGSSGNPKGLWTWAGAGAGNFVDAGRRIFARRLGAWLIIVNTADAPSGYNVYAPSHLAGGFTPRTEDTLTSTDWAQMVTDGVLSGGETLAHYDPANYSNTPITNKLIEKAPSVWTGFTYGPRQAHPDDSANGLASHTLSNVPWMARDNTLNDGSSVSTSADFTLGPLEAVALKVT